jgi:hypothetical protein
MHFMQWPFRRLYQTQELNMHTTMSTTRIRKSLSRSLPGAVAALGLALALPGVAQAMASSVDDHFISAEVSAPLTPRFEASPAVALASDRTREDVNEDLQRARAINLMTPNSELGDTPEVLQAREDFYAMRTEVMLADQARVADELAQQQARRLALADMLDDGEGPMTDIRLVPDAGQTVQPTGTEPMPQVENRVAEGQKGVLVIENETATEDDMDW